MPLGRWKTFGQCVGAQKRLGHSGISSRKICGRIQADIEGGSSIMTRGGAGDYMSQQQMPPDREKEEDGGSKITFTESEMTQLVQTASDEGATKTLALLKEKVNVEEEGPGPAGPPTPKKAPPFGR